MKKLLTKGIKLILCLMVVFSIDHIHVLAQDSNKTKVTIIKESVDEEGNKTVERIIIEGEDAKKFDFEEFKDHSYEKLDEDDFSQEGHNWMRFKQFENEDGTFGQSIIIGDEEIDLSKFFNFDFSEKGLPLFEDDDLPFGRNFESFSSSKPKLGIQIKGLENQSGVQVTTVMEGSVAEDVGIEAGDIILSMNDEVMEKPQDVVQFIHNTEPGTEILIDILRDGEPRQIIASLKEETPKKEKMIIKKI
jgi:membrane-associated protease RseP (regulator of RpoE activity)